MNKLDMTKINEYHNRIRNPYIRTLYYDFLGEPLAEETQAEIKRLSEEKNLDGLWEFIKKNLEENRAKRQTQKQ